MAVIYIDAGDDDGTCFGQSATDKIGFYGKTPIVQPAAPTDATTVIAALKALGLVAT
jgi:hypothetical protein